MQEFAASKTIAQRMDLRPLNCLFRKYRMAVRIMKLATIILLAACLQLSARGITQTVTISVKDAPLVKVLKAIEKQTDFVFFISSEEIKRAKNVSITAKNLPLQQVLDLCFKDQPLTYTITGKLINVVPRIVKVDKYDKTNFTAPLPANIDIKGRVVDENGQSVSGATVTVHGTTKSTSTDANGVFELRGVDETATLEITHVQYNLLTIKLNGNGFITAKLQVKVSALDELQVIAYGTTTRRFSTGNVSSVKASDIEKQPVSNPLLALEGKAPGLFITQQSGLTGTPVKVRIQGQNSISKGNDPLVVIDGVPFFSDIPPTGNESALNSSGAGSGNPSPLNFINSNDIESIDILKDADATAIYGSRAASGAILITTKKGKSGPARIDLNLQQGWGKVTRMLDVLNTRQYLDMRYEALKNDGISTIPQDQYDLKLWDTTRSTEWQNLLIGGTEKYSNANFSISGGAGNIQYFVGGTFNKTTTVFPGDFNDQRGAVHFNLSNSSLNQKFRMQFSGNFMGDRNQLPGTDFTGQAILLEPVAPTLYNSDGTLNWAPNTSGSSTWTNPLAYTLYTKSDIKTNNLVSNLVLGYTILPGFDVKSSFGYTNLQTNDFKGFEIGSVAPENRNVTPNPRTALYGKRLIHSWIVEPQLTYHKTIAKGELEGLLGYTINQEEREYNTLKGVGFSNDAALRNPQAATSLTINSLGYSLYKYNAVFGRLNYNWANKYILNLTVRRDGSSRYGDKNKFHNFGSIGGAWIMSEESFFPKNLRWFSFAKLRGSYGTTGNDQIGDYAYYSLYGNTSVSVAYQNSAGLKPNGLSNPYLQWEETRKIQGGIDLGFFHDRIILNATYAFNSSSNQLVGYSLPSITGFTSITTNFPATVQNTSWEFSMNTTNIRSKVFSWSSSINLTIPKNKLASFPDLEKSPSSSTLVVGQPISIIKAYKFAGVDPTTGIYQFFDAKGNLTNSPNSTTDNTALINTLPKFYGGFQNTFIYKGLELDFTFQFIKQIGSPILFNNGTLIVPGNFAAGNSNQPVTILNRWQKSDDVSSIQRFSTYTFPLFFNLANARTSNAGYTDASYVRLKNLSISWRIPNHWQQRLHMKNFKVYIQCQNLITITHYQGLDPENQSVNGLPPLRVITAGVRFGF